MSVLEFILSGIGALLGCTTLLGWVFYRNANRRIKDAEAERAQAEAERAKVDTENATRDMYEETLRNMREEHAERTKELRATIADVNLMYHTAIKDGARKDEIIDDKVAKIRELNETINTLYKKINDKDNYSATLKRYIDWLKLWHCEREQPSSEMNEDEIAECCTRRKPPHKMPVKYKPFKDIKAITHDD